MPRTNPWHAHPRFSKLVFYECPRRRPRVAVASPAHRNDPNAFTTFSTFSTFSINDTCPANRTGAPCTRSGCRGAPFRGTVALAPRTTQKSIANLNYVRMELAMTARPAAGYIAPRDDFSGSIAPPGAASLVGEWETIFWARFVLRCFQHLSLRA